VPFDTAKGGLLHAALIARKEEIENDLKSKFGVAGTHQSDQGRVHAEEGQQAVRLDAADQQEDRRAEDGLVEPRLHRWRSDDEAEAGRIQPRLRDNIIKVLMDKGWQAGKLHQRRQA
jgi:hypothetical protein